MFSSTQTANPLTTTQVLMSLDAYQCFLDRTNAETQVLPASPLAATETALWASHELDCHPDEAPASGSTWELVAPNSPLLSETQKDVLYGLSVGALVGATTTVLFFLLTL